MQSNDRLEGNNSIENRPMMGIPSIITIMVMYIGLDRIMAYVLIFYVKSTAFFFAGEQKEWAFPE